MGIMKNDVFKFLGFFFTTTEALKIIKEINQSIDNPQCITTLEEFAFSCEYYDGITYIEWEDYVYNYFIHLEEHLFENITYETINYNDFISIAEIIVRHTKYTALELKKSFEDLLFDVLLDSKNDDLENKLAEEHNLENELKNRYGFRNIQFCLSEECDNLEVRYERITYKKDVEVFIETYDDLKEELIISIIEEIKNDIKLELDNLTKNDTEVNRETLSNDEVIQAFNNTKSKFIELYDQQPQELKHILIDYKETPLKDYLVVIQDAIHNSDDIKLLDKIFQTYKRDEQHRIYNYDLFAFLYYAYSLNISFEHLYNSELLKLLGAYRYAKNRDKPSLKTDVLKRFNEGKTIALQFQCENNIYIENFEQFIKNAELKKINLYILSFLVDISHNITESKNFLQLITAKDNYHKINYENLPIPINTLLLQPQQIAN